MPGSLSSLHATFEIILSFFSYENLNSDVIGMLAVNFPLKDHRDSLHLCTCLHFSVNNLFVKYSLNTSVNIQLQPVLPSEFNLKSCVISCYVACCNIWLY
jgi:hypothetical protein